MDSVSPLLSDLAYLGRLIAAGWQGTAGIRLHRDPRPKAGLWTPAVVGAAMGAMGTRAFGRRKSPSGVALGGAIGTVVGCGAATAWAARGLFVPAARAAVAAIDAARDEHWLEANPIDYA